jgi:hypothetical protein
MNELAVRAAGRSRLASAETLTVGRSDIGRAINSRRMRCAAREREVVRELYLQTRCQLQALAAALELEGLE